jgi:hypothetical protein
LQQHDDEGHVLENKLLLGFVRECCHGFHSVRPDVALAQCHH